MRVCKVLKIDSKKNVVYVQCTRTGLKSTITVSNAAKYYSIGLTIEVWNE